MNAPKERILIVESDPTISDLISRQTLVPLGYRVHIAGAATSALHDAIRFGPDLVITNLNLPDLSGKDLLVAFSSQGLEVPIIVIAEKGMEGDVIQAFRLGAADFLTYPIREAEVVAAVERIIKQVRSKRERELLSRQLNQTNQELQRRVRELTTIFSIGKAVISTTDLGALLDKIIEGAVYVSEAESGWLLTRDERTKTFLLSAFRNLPRSVAAFHNQAWDDGLSSLVALSGETLAIHGDPLKRFKISALGQSALVVPVKVKSEVVGLIVVVRKSPQPFGNSSQALLEAVADYASIAMVNARLFRALEERVRNSQRVADNAKFSEKIVDELLQGASRQLADVILSTRSNLDMLTQGLPSQGTGNPSEILAMNLDFIEEMISTLDHSKLPGIQSIDEKPNLNELVRISVQRFRTIAQVNEVQLQMELTSLPVVIQASAFHVIHILDGLISYAIRFFPENGQVNLRVHTHDNLAQVTVHNFSAGIDEGQLESIFTKEESHLPLKESGEAIHFAGLGISLRLAREIVKSYGGSLWAESKSGEGASFHMTLPLNSF